ncbi:MAG: efflux RND transporter periplasmic adaptor subunit [Bacillota bacterium]
MKKKIMISAGIGVVLLASLGWTLSNQGVEAETAQAVQGHIQKYAEDIGEIKCKNSTTVYLEGNGLIKTILVEEDQTVKKGDLLLTMDQEQLGIAYQNTEESYRQALAQVSAGKETYLTALKDYNNTKMLAAEGAVSQWELTQKESAMNSAKAIYSGYQAQLDQAELTRQNGSVALNKQKVLSPIDGTILEKNAELNQLGTPGTAAFVIGNAKDIEIEVKILADDVSGIEIGKKAEIITRTEDEKVIEGIVTKIAPTAIEETSSLGVRQKKVAVIIKPLDSVKSLKIGSEADVKIITQEKSNAVIVPVSAVFDYQGGSCVFVVESGKALIRAVEIGIRNKSNVEIINGLKEGEIVLAAPDNSIEEGMRIKI